MVKRRLPDDPGIIKFRKNCYLRGSLRLISGVFNLSLFIFILIKVLKKSRRNYGAKLCKTSRRLVLASFSISDLQLFFISLYDFITCMFYTALFTDKYSDPVTDVKEDNRPDAFGYTWAVTCVFVETGSLISYTLYAIYTVVVMIKAISQTRHINSVNRSQSCCKLSLCITDRTMKIIFMTIQIVVPFICAFVPLVVKNGYVYSRISTWPFITDDDALSVIFYYDFVVIALIMTIIQLIVTLIRLVSLNRLSTMLNEQIQKNAINQINSSDDDADAFNMLEMDDDSMPSDSSRVNKIVESVSRKAKREKMMFLTAMFKNIGFSVCYLIEWSISLVTRLILLSHNKYGGEKDYYPSDALATLFAIGGPSLSFLNAIFYFLRLGIITNIANKKRKPIIAPSAAQAKPKQQPNPIMQIGTYNSDGDASAPRYI